MSIVSCPRCGDKVSIPPAASPSALVQCPLCLEEYFLSDALIQLPPMLVVVGGHAASPEKDAEYRLAEPVTAGISDAVFDTSSAAAATVAPRPRLRTVTRPRRQERSFIGETIKVMLGGVAGLGGGLLVLWWVFGVDVGVGPRLSQVEYLRWMVPKKFWDDSVPRAKAPADLDTLDANAKQARRNGNSAKAGGGLTQPTEDVPTADSAKTDKLASDSSDSASQETDNPPTKTSAKAKGKKKGGKKKADDDPFQKLESLGGETKPSTSDTPELKIDDPLSAVTPKSRDKTKTEERPEKPKSKSTPGDAKPSSTEDSNKEKAISPAPKPVEATPENLAVAIEAAREASDAFGTLDRSDRDAVQGAATELYLKTAAISPLAARLNLEDPDLGEHAAKLKECLQTLAEDSLKVNAIAQLAAQQIEEGKREEIVIAGTVKDFKSAGDFFETTVGLPKVGKTVAVLTTGDPQDFFKVNDQVIVLGTLLREPQKAAQGYRGDAEVAVKSAYAATVPAATPGDVKPTEKKPQDAIPKESKPADAKPESASPEERKPE